MSLQKASIKSFVEVSSEAYNEVSQLKQAKKIHLVLTDLFELLAVLKTLGVDVAELTYNLKNGNLGPLGALAGVEGVQSQGLPAEHMKDLMSAVSAIKNVTEAVTKISKRQSDLESAVEQISSGVSKLTEALETKMSDIAEPSVDFHFPKYNQFSKVSRSTESATEQLVQEPAAQNSAPVVEGATPVIVIQPEATFVQPEVIVAHPVQAYAESIVVGIPTPATVTYTEETQTKQEVYQQPSVNPLDALDSINVVSVEATTQVAHQSVTQQEQSVPVQRKQVKIPTNVRNSMIAQPND